MKRRVRLRLLLLALTATAGGVRAADSSLAFLPDEQVLARAETMPIEERRQLVYLYARLNKPKLAETLAAQILKENPRDRQTLLVLASMYVEQRDPMATLEIARRFLSYYPGDHQGRYFLGAGHYLAKQYAEANRVLRELKTEQFAQKKYPYETDLAASAYAAGDWYRAMLSYQELLRHHTLGDELRDEVRRVLDGLYREHLPRWEAQMSETRLEHSRVWRYSAANAQHISDRHWLEERFLRDDIELDPVAGLRAAREDRAEAAVTLTTTYDRRWRTDFSVGASREGLTAAGRVHVALAKDREAAVEIVYNERALDSLALEALDGRQHRAGVTVNWLIEADLSFVGRLGLREVRAGGQKLGHGSGVDLNLDQTLWRQGPRVIVGYRGSIATFSPENNAALDPATATPIADPASSVAARQALLGGLVSRRINRHGAGVQITDNLAGAWVYRLSAGLDYDFELESTGWNAGLLLSFWPRKSLELTAEAGYSSSANASNAGSAAALGSFFIRAYY